MITSKNPVSVSIPREGLARFYVSTCSKTEAGALIMGHGMYKTKAYKCWWRIKDRCNNPNSTRYRDYGGRGIKVCDEWLDDFLKFYDHVSNLPHFGERGYSIDREDNDGDYEEGNVQWSDDHTQNANQRLRVTNKSGYAGVYMKRNRHVSCIVVNRNRIILGYFNSAYKAAVIRDQYVIDNELWEYKLQVLTNPN